MHFALEYLFRTKDFPNTARPLSDANVVSFGDDTGIQTHTCGGCVVRPRISHAHAAASLSSPSLSLDYVGGLQMALLLINDTSTRHEKAPRLREGLFLGEGLGRGALGPKRDVIPDYLGCCC
jgi:hypothetical protein